MLIPRGLESFLQRNLNLEKMYRKKFAMKTRIFYLSLTVHINMELFNYNSDRFNNWNLM